MTDLFHQPLARIAEALQKRELSSSELVKEALARHDSADEALDAYKHWDSDGAESAALAADERLASGSAAPFCGIPVSVKDLYGVVGMPTYAGTAKRFPPRWEEDAWLITQLRAQGAVFVGKTHTVELAYAGVGINPHWGTPRNPWDADSHRIPGGSSCGAGVSLHEGSALVALGSDTGGSIRIPASLTGTVGHKLTYGRWPVDGVVPLSSSLDTVGALTRSVEDSLYFFGAIDPGWGDPQSLLWQLSTLAAAGLRVGVPRCGIWDDCQPDIAAVLHGALDELTAAAWGRVELDGELLDRAYELYMTGGIAGSEGRDFLERELPEWLDILHPTVGDRLAMAPKLDSEERTAALAMREELMGQVDGLFAETDVLALPTAIITPPLVADLADNDRYVKTNAATLRPTCPASLLGLCAITVPVGLDEAGMPVGLQLVAQGGRDEALLGTALAVERVLGTAESRLGSPPALPV